MEKTLKVIKPFFVMEEGDMFERTENNTYVSEYKSEYKLDNDMFKGLHDFSSTYNSRFEISADYAAALVELGHLEEVKEKSNDFVNVFDEIERLAKEYDTDLDNLDEDFKDAPACMKLEKETVLKNMLKVLEHLHSLKK